MQAASPGTPAPRRPSYATIVLGSSSFGAAIGFFLGSWVGVAFLGMGLIDNNQWLPIAFSTGAGIGWVLGAVIGSNVGRGARSSSRPGRIALYGSAMAVMVAMVVLLRLEGVLAEGGAPFLSHGRLAWYRAMTVLCAVLATTTFVGIAGRNEPDERRPGRFVYLVASIGAGILALLLLAVGIQVRQELASQRSAQLARPVERTVRSLIDAAAEYEEVHDAFPQGVGPLLSSGARIHPTAVLVYGGRSGKGFCVIVAHEGPDGAAVEPFMGGVVRSHSQTVGHHVSCRRDRGLRPASAAGERDQLPVTEPSESAGLAAHPIVLEAPARPVPCDDRVPFAALEDEVIR